MTKEQWKRFGRENWMLISVIVAWGISLTMGEMGDKIYQGYLLALIAFLLVKVFWYNKRKKA